MFCREHPTECLLCFVTLASFCPSDAPASASIRSAPYPGLFPSRAAAAPPKADWMPSDAPPYTFPPAGVSSRRKCPAAKPPSRPQCGRCTILCLHRAKRDFQPAGVQKALRPNEAPAARQAAPFGRPLSAAPLKYGQTERDTVY